MRRLDVPKKLHCVAFRRPSWPLLIAWCLGASALPTLAQSAPRTFRVSYLSMSAVYIDGGRAEQLAAGSRLQIVRGSEVIALLEISYLADHSSSCRVISQSQPPKQGDRVVLLAPVEPAAAETAPQSGGAERAAPKVVSPLPTQVSAIVPRLRVTRLSGSAALGFQRSSDRGPAGQNYDQGTGRLGLQLRDIHGLPLQVRVRMSGWQLRQSGFGPGAATSLHSNRLYELSMTYAPDESRFYWAVGRLGASPFVSIGYLDGGLGQFRVTRRFYVGAFAGSQPEILALHLASAGRKYGAFARYSTRPEDGPGYGEVVVAGVGEYARNGQPSREYAALDSRFGRGDRWSLFEHLEVDLNRGWRRTVSGRSSQISNASLSASAKLSQTLQAQLSYQQRRNYLTFQTRPLPEEVFTRIFNEGARASLQWQSRSGWNVSGGVGQERSDARGSKPTNSGSLSVYKTNLFGWSLTAGADASFYDGGIARGFVASARARKAIGSGNDLGLTLGMSSAQITSLDLAAPTRRNQWVRLSGTWRLPWSLYLMGEAEYDTGDDVNGTRYLLEVGYTF